MPARLRRSLLIPVFCLLLLTLGAAAPGWGANLCTDAAKDPAFISKGVEPNVLFILDNSESMNQFAYHETAGCWYPGGWYAYYAWTGYDEGKQYYGYFNPDKTYKYDNTHHYFYAVGDVVDDPTTSIHERAACLASNCTQRAFSGNWLNWWTMRRFDVAKKVLTGGRVADDAGDYALIGSPHDIDTYRIYNDYAAGDTPSYSPNVVPTKKVYYTPFHQGIVSYFFTDDPTLRSGQFVPLFTVMGAKFDRAGDMTGTDCVEPQAASNNVLTSVAAYDNSGESGKLYASYYVAVKVDARPTGIIQQMADRVRFGYMQFNFGVGPGEGYPRGTWMWGWDIDGDGNYDLSFRAADGGRIRNRVGDDSTVTTPQGDTILSIVDNINEQTIEWYTPLEEVLNEAMRYFEQASACYAPGNGGSDYQVSSLWDPYYFDGDYQECAKSFVILVSDGGANNNDGTNHCGNVGATFSGNQAGELLDDIAFRMHTTDQRSGAQLSGDQTVGLYTVFCFDDSEAAKDEMKAAARAGGFEDLDGDGQPYCGGAWPCAACTGPGNHPAGCREWDKNGDGIPDNYFEAQDGDNLTKALLASLADILQKTSSGTAASVVASSRSGEGALYQALFFPDLQSLGPHSDFRDVGWVGDVHALFLDGYGHTFEDTNDNQTFDAADQQVSIYFDAAYGDTRACYGTVISGSCNGTAKNLEQVHYLWSAAQWLYNRPNGNIGKNRTPYISNNPERYIFTWFDLNDDGIVDRGATCNEVAAFEARQPTSKWAVDFPSSCNVTDNGPINRYFAAADLSKTNDIIDWVRGDNGISGTRARDVWVDSNKDGTLNSLVTWRLGDIVNSTPLVVASPAENYDLLYSDASYGAFARHWRGRRTVVYFGANDGMLHAVNGGFYKADEKHFCRAINASGHCDSSGPVLGAELWAYVPYNLLSHLKCLADPDYPHAYFVDLHPKAFDVRIFPDDTDHPGGWGTILVCGMRFGGTPVSAGQLDLNGDGVADDSADDRVFTSGYVILDITNPEVAPVLLGETTRTTSASDADLGYTTAEPVVVPMKDGDTTKWYLVFGSGPTTLRGASTQRANLCVLPLDSLVGTQKTLRIPAALPTTGNEAGCFELSDNNTFISTPITVDFDLLANYKADAVYFGTVSGSSSSWGGKLYRLVTRKLDANGTQVMTAPDEWSSLVSGHTNPSVLLDAHRPITAPPAAAWDGKHDWIFFGTGRFYDPLTDKTDTSTQAYYGIMEPMSNGEFTWDTVEVNGTANSTAGAQGLVRVDQIEVTANATAATTILTCSSGGTGCLPAGVSSYADLISYVTGERDGWYRLMTRSRERNLGQAALLGGLLLYTTYQPTADLCTSGGESYLDALYYLTGVPWRQPVWAGGTDASGHVEGEIDLGQGMSTSPSLHLGKEKGMTAYVQPSTGEIKEIQLPELPVDETVSGSVGWHEIEH